MIRLEDWALVTKCRGTFLTPEMVKNKDLHIRRVVVLGRIPQRDNPAKYEFFKSGLVKSIRGNKIIAEDAEHREIVLGKPAKDYQEFTEAVKQGMPVVINWVIGKDAMLFANVYENGTVSYLCEKVQKQNWQDRTLTLANGKVVYVVWRNINIQMWKQVSAIKNFVNWKQLFPKNDFPLQIDVFMATSVIWGFPRILSQTQTHVEKQETSSQSHSKEEGATIKLLPYEWIFDSPHNFAILNEDSRTTK